MDNTVKFCLALSSEGEAHLQKHLHSYPHCRDGILYPREMYQAKGSVLRVWEHMDASDDSPLLNFIYEALETLSPDQYRYVLISPHGDGQYDGDYEGPHNLRMVHFPEAEYEPDGTHVPEPQAPVVHSGRPNIVCEQMCSFLMDGDLALNEDVLRSELQDRSNNVRLGLVENSDDYLGDIMDLAENNRGNDLHVRFFMRVEPVVKGTPAA